MEYTPYRKNGLNVSDDDILDVADYATSAAGIMGVDTTLADVALFATHAARLTITPSEVQKPQNETAKLIASGASILFGAATGNKRASSALGLIAKGIIDLTINN